MRQAEFESLLFVEVADRAATEPAPSANEGTYGGRPWTRLRDEMLGSGAKTVEELRADRIAAFYKATNRADRGVLSSLRGLFGGAD